MKNVVGIWTYWTWKRYCWSYDEQGYSNARFAGVLKDACANIFSWDRILLEGNTKESVYGERQLTNGILID